MPCIFFLLRVHHGLILHKQSRRTIFTSSSLNLNKKVAHNWEFHLKNDEFLTFLQNAKNAIFSRFLGNVE